MPNIKATVTYIVADINHEVEDLEELTEKEIEAIKSKAQEVIKYDNAILDLEIIEIQEDDEQTSDKN
jgi:hypothetical protein